MACGKFFLLLGLLVNIVDLQKTGSGTNGNLRLCVVKTRGTYERAPKYCPILDEQNSGVECVIGTDRLDCLRRIGKGTVDFGVFSPEDLLAAQWANLDVLVTTEMRLRSRPFERSIVAVVNRRILPDSVTSASAVLRNSTLCHPGVSTDDIRPLSNTLEEYLESLVTAKSCDPKLTLAENRIKSLSEFFYAACRPGPWVLDAERNAQLKSRYANLCAACSFSLCSSTDRYYGDAGALTCLDEGAGDVTWAVLDDVHTYFGLRTAANQFAFLCVDGSWQPLTGNPNPCVWVNRPWPVVVAKRKASVAVSTLTSQLTNSSVSVSNDWRGALSQLLESNQALPEPLQPAHAPIDYLTRARGFIDAYSQTGCHPPRHITLCASSRLAKNKCEWLSEAAAVYGVQPPLQCTYREHLLECMEDISTGAADAAVGGSDWLVPAIRDHQLVPVLHELTPVIDKISTVLAYVKDDSIKKMADLRGKRAFFPRYDGFAWHAVLKMLQNESNSCHDIVNNYFSDICAPGIERYDVLEGTKSRLSQNCYKDGEKVLDGEVQALRSLVEGKSDVAFISMNTYNLFKDNLIQEPWALGYNPKNIKPICPEKDKNHCFISWSSIGHIFARKNITSMRRQEIVNLFKNLDHLFGRQTPFHTSMFSMYKSFNHEIDVLFHNNTWRLSTDDALSMHPYNNIKELNFESQILKASDVDQCYNTLFNFGNNLVPVGLVIVISLVFSFNQSWSFK